MTYSNIIETLRRQWIVLAVVMAVGFVAFLIAFPHFRKYTATATMLAANAPAGDSGVLDPTRDPISSAVSLGDLQSLATSPSLLDAVETKLHLSDREAARFPGEVKAKALFASDILPISVTDPDPALAVSGTNVLIEELSRYAERIATGRYDQLIADLQRQITERKADLAQIDARINAVSSGDFYLTPETGTAGIETRLVALQQQEQQLESAVGGDVAAASVVAEQPAISHALARHEILAQDPSVVAQRAQLGKDVAALNLALSGYTLSYPGLKGMILQVKAEAAEVAKAENRTAANPGESESYVNAEISANKTRATLESDRAQLAAVRSQLSDMQAHLTGSAGAGSQISQLRRARSISENVFTDLGQRLARARADRAEAASIGSVVIIDHATHASPALLGSPLVLGVAFLVIFGWIAVTLAFMLDGADDHLRTPEAIGKLYGKPVFTAVG
jgi:uncharacterized protein involved in exopolysaccharide biosynthesis